jgi:hypothetical protein
MSMPLEQIQYLQEHSGESFCRLCLIQLASLYAFELTNRANKKHVNFAFWQGHGVCSICERQGHVVSAVESSTSNRLNQGASFL